MFNEYQNKLLRGDTLTVLNNLPNGEFINLTVTSPPYNKLTLYPGEIVKAQDYTTTSDIMPEDEYQLMQIDVLNRIYDLSVPGSSLFYNHKLRHKDQTIIHPILWLCRTKWVLRQEIVWDRIISPNLKGHWFYQIDERVWWLYKPPVPGRLKQEHAQYTSIWRAPPERSNPKHPAPFPIWLPDRIIKSMQLPKGSLVFDPYVGSGTTALAALINGHNYLGVDSSAEYLKLAQQRIDNYSNNPAIFA